jgi:hypothetical protein
MSHLHGTPIKMQQTSERKKFLGVQIRHSPHINHLSIASSEDFALKNIIHLV